MITAIYIIVGILAVLLLVALFIPAGFSVKRSVVVNKPLDQVYQYALDFTKFNEWSPWYEMEPTAEVTITFTGKAGDKYAWVGKKVGEGSFTLLSFEPNKKIHTQIDFLKPWKTTAQNFYHFEADGNNTRMTWEHQGVGAYPIGRYFNLMMDGMLGKDFQKGLEKLKSNLEK